MAKANEGVSITDATGIVDDFPAGTATIEDPDDTGKRSLLVRDDKGRTLALYSEGYWGKVLIRYG